MHVRTALIAVLVATLLAGCALPVAWVTVPQTTVEPTPELSNTTQIDPEPVVRDTLEGRWEGAISVLGTELDIIVNFSGEGEQLTGTIDIPPQNVTDLELHDITFEAPAVHFEMLTGPQLAVFEGTLAEGVISGTFLQAGVEGTFELVAVEAAPAAAEQTQTEDVYTAPEGRFTVPVPTNWSVEQHEGYAVLTPPEGQIEAIVLALPGDDVESGIEAAWEIVDPTFDLEISDTIDVPAPSGIEEMVIVNYDEEDEEDDDRIVQAIGQLHEGTVYVQLYRGDVETAQRRAAQIQIIATGFKITAVAEDTLAGVTPLPLTDEMLAELEAYIVEKMEQLDVPGAAVSIVHGGEIIYAEGFGTRGPDTDEPITPETQFMIGSTGKTMTTMLMATLVDAGLLDWDMPVVEILPQFAVADPELTQQLTVRNLVCACTGVPRRDYELIFNTDDLTAEDVIEQLATYEFFTDFGEAFQYSNQMVATGGYVAAAADGGEWGNLYNAYARSLQARVLAPIGMEDTTISFDEVVARDNYALPHGQDLDGNYSLLPLEIEESFVTPIAPAGGHWSTVLDMARYLITELNQGVTPDGNRVVSAENLAETWVPQVAILADTSYGLGWMISDYKDLQLIAHGGNTLGFTSDLAFLPEADIGISVLTNGRATNLFNEAVRFRLLEMIYDQAPEMDAQVAFAQERTEQTYQDLAADLGDAVDPAAVETHLGRYTNPALGEITLALIEGEFILDIGEFQAVLLPYEDEDAEAGQYLAYTAPLAGIPIQLQENEAGDPIVVVGGGVTEYTFDRLEE